MKLNETALLLIDLQKESKYDLIDINSVIANTKELIACCKKYKIPVIYTRHINRDDGIALSYKEPLDEKGRPIYYNSSTDSVNILDEIKPEDKDIVIDKYRWSAFFDTSLDLTLKSLNIKHLITGGFVTDGCVMNTVFDAFHRGYQVNLIKDICSTTNSGAHKASILIMCNWVYGMDVYDTKEIMKKIEGKKHTGWQWTEPDGLKFTEDNLREVFDQLTPLGKEAFAAAKGGAQD